MGDLIQLQERQVQTQRRKLAARLLAIQDEVLREMIELLLGDGTLNYSSSREELATAVTGTPTGELLSELAAHLGFAAVELSGPTQ